ncbi:hypothetical protein EMCRGX_G010517, partial [Ephydatia muelleri]
MCGKIKVLQPYLLPYSYSLFEPNSRTLAEYGVSLEKAILRDSELLSDVNNAFCNSHPLLAQKVVTRSARAAVSKISADALLAKAISVRRSQAGAGPSATACSSAGPTACSVTPADAPPNAAPAFFTAPATRMALPRGGGGGEEEEEEAEEEEAAKLFSLSK